MKLTTLERRAYNACEQIKQSGSYAFSVYWSKSSTWGMCPRVMWYGEKVAHASGCGYDKLSACLCDFLKFLLPDAHLPCSGAGVSSVQEYLRKHGWELLHTYDGKAEDEFEIRRIDETR